MAHVVMAAGIDAAEILILSSPISACRSAEPKRFESPGQPEWSAHWQGAIVEPGTDDHVSDQACICGRQTLRHQRTVDGFQIGQRHMRQNHILLMADTDFVEGVFFGDISDRIHLHMSCIARNTTNRLQEMVTMP